MKNQKSLFRKPETPFQESKPITWEMTPEESAIFMQSLNESSVRKKIVV